MSNLELMALLCCGMTLLVYLLTLSVNRSARKFANDCLETAHENYDTQSDLTLRSYRLVEKRGE